MKILFLTSAGYLPSLRGGLELTTDNLAHRCLRAGHEPVVLSGLSKANDWFAWKGRVQAKLSSNAFAEDYAVYIF